MTTNPPYLQSGDVIGLVCPSGWMAAERVQCCVDMLHGWGYHVKTGMTIGGNSSNYFSGSDEERLQDLQEMLDDPQISAILCARGGYGLTRIIDKINFTKFLEKPKWIIGFSDITILHSHIYSNFGITTLHAVMANAFNDADEDDKSITSFRKALEGKKINYTVPVHPFNRKGEVIGELVGGNLAMIAHGIGSDSDIKTKGRILFLEDVGEYRYNIDRMTYQLKRAGKFSKLGGLIVGGFTDMKDTARPFGKETEEIIADVISGYDFPVSFGFPVSHGRENLALKIGTGYKLKVGKNNVRLEE
jgi:muramoyltetrapeptide carboxypeptidase